MPLVQPCPPSQFRVCSGHLILGGGGGDDVSAHSGSSLRLYLDNCAKLGRVNTLHETHEVFT